MSTYTCQYTYMSVYMFCAHVLCTCLCTCSVLAPRLAMKGVTSLCTATSWPAALSPSPWYFFYTGVDPQPISIVDGTALRVQLVSKTLGTLAVPQTPASSTLGC